MIAINPWTDHFLQALNKTFGDRVWFVGLQGSYGRGEATETSDIDLVVVLHELSPEDVETYGRMLDTLPNRDLICGFLSGRKELLNWDPSDLFQFYHDTTPLQGSLDELLLQIDDAAVARAIKTGACNLYHGCVHNMLYEKDEAILRSLYKSASFLVQAVCFQQTGRYVKTLKGLLPLVSTGDQTIIRTFLKLKSGGAAEFADMSRTLFLWAKHWVQNSPNPSNPPAGAAKQSPASDKT